MTHDFINSKISKNYIENKVCKTEDQKTDATATLSVEAELSVNTCRITDTAKVKISYTSGFYKFYCQEESANTAVSCGYDKALTNCFDPNFKVYRICGEDNSDSCRYTCLYKGRRVICDLTTVSAGTGESSFHAYEENIVRITNRKSSKIYLHFVEAKKGNEAVTLINNT